MPRMTKEEFDALPARFKPAPVVHPGRPVLNEIIASEAVPAGTEIELHRAIIKELRRLGHPYVYHDPTRPTGATLGTPDFIIVVIVAAAWTVLFVECKTRTGKLSKSQEKFRDRLKRYQTPYFIVRSMDDFANLPAIYNRYES